MRAAAAVGCLATAGLTVAACGGGSSGGATSGAGSPANTTAYCNQARQVQQAETGVAASPDGLKNLFATFDKLAAVSPSQVAPSIRTVSAFYNRLLAALGSNSPTNQAAFTNAVNTALNGQQSQVQTAGQKFIDYTKKTCGIDLGGSGSTTTAKP
jgi:hypothetical protein